MKQNINPAVIVTAIVAVLAVACYFGIKALNPDQSSSHLQPSEYKSKMEEMTAKHKQEIQSHAGGGMSSGMYQQRMQQMRSGGSSGQ